MKRLIILSIVVIAVLSASARAQTGSLSKTAFESFDVSMDFANRASMGITIDSVTAVLTTTGRDVTTNVISASPAPAVVPMTERVTLRVKGGVVGETYNIAIRVIKTDTSEKLEGNISLRILSAQ